MKIWKVIFHTKLVPLIDDENVKIENFNLNVLYLCQIWIEEQKNFNTRKDFLFE